MSIERLYKSEVDCSRCNIATVDSGHENGVGERKHTAILLVCHSFPSFHIMSKQFFAPGLGV